MKNLLTSVCVFAACALGAAEPASFTDAIAQGKVSINARLRYEGVQQTGLRDADAHTLRTRLGYTTAAWKGWKFMVEAENVTAVDGDSYSQAGLNPGGAGKAVVADPESTEINQAFAAYTNGKTTVTLGRQRLVLDNARFVGDVGWRQNQQTFDAVSVQDKSFAKTTLTYAYLHQINRIFSDRHAQGDWASDSHVLNAGYTGFAAGTLSAYTYLLDFDNSAPNSTATYGASFSGAQKISGDTKVSYRLEGATQSDYGSSTLNYRASYLALEAGLVLKQGGIALGQERLGSDNNVGFKTPLATLHAFNGWADQFLGTPAAGLRDTYVKANASLPGGVALLAFYHWYETDRTGVELGTEFNLQASRKFGKFVTATAKYADFSRDSLSFPNVSKVWLQLEFVY
ncbi:MAG: alginate export family protein [Candidatus Didemnitutus sp.]|nr:alginate export family protein [Candidatus Didemnitutus sp.]